MTPAASPRSIAIFGSCTTHDNFNSRFNADHHDRYSVDVRANQTSVITMMSPPVEEDFTPTRPMRDYDVWNVRSDLSREFLPLLAEAKPDFLILDFFADIHFGVLRLEDGRYLTNNRWKLWHTDLYEQLKERNAFTRLRIFDDPDAYFALWSEAMDRFARFLAEHCPDTRVIVHRGLNVDRVIPADAEGMVPLRGFRPMVRVDEARANERWARLDDHAISTYGWDAIDLRGEGYTSYAEHPWKAFYVHYTPDYYHRFLSELHVLDLTDRVDPETLERVRSVAMATREQSTRQSQFAHSVITEQDARIGELEQAGVLRAARRALAQRRAAKVEGRTR
jgi:hypothetical protein